MRIDEKAKVTLTCTVQLVTLLSIGHTRNSLKSKNKAII